MLNGVDVCYKLDILLSFGLYFFSCVYNCIIVCCIWYLLWNFDNIKSCIFNDNDEIMIEDLLNLM